MPANQFTLALAQTNMVVGDIQGNAQKIISFARRAEKEKVNLLVFPEMALPGYPCEDLVLVRAFRETVHAALLQIAKQLEDVPFGILLGTLWEEEGAIYNASILLEKGSITPVRTKRRLPNYGVFDEKRVFAKGSLPAPITYQGLSLGVLICEEVWDEKMAEHMASHQVDLLVVQNGSPYYIGKAGERLAVVQRAAKLVKAPVAYVNLIGGQDELVFDGRSYLLAGEGADPIRANPFAEDLQILHFTRTGNALTVQETPDRPALSDDETIYRALVLGLRDYVQKNGFPGIVVGLSGGIDSGLSAAIAVDAIGADKVLTVRMPSPYTSNESIEDALLQAKALSIAQYELPIHDLMRDVDEDLAALFIGRAKDTTEENIQARLRGLLLMAISNKLGHMVLTTGNKSEMSVGYATLYGDMCGGFSVLKDVYKTTVFRLSKWRNTLDDAALQEAGFLGGAGEVIPKRMIEKPPSAELRENQKDEDSLPPYEVLDEILRGLIERRLSVGELIAEGMEEATVRKIARLLGAAEYKRRQSAPGVKITPMSFGRDRRIPITNHWKFEG